jgi:hypothetical protein
MIAVSGHFKTLGMSPAWPLSGALGNAPISCPTCLYALGVQFMGQPPVTIGLHMVIEKLTSFGLKHCLSLDFISIRRRFKASIKSTVT